MFEDQILDTLFFFIISQIRAYYQFSYSNPLRNFIRIFINPTNHLDNYIHIRAKMLTITKSYPERTIIVIK